MQYHRTVLRIFVTFEFYKNYFPTTHIIPVVSNIYALITMVLRLVDNDYPVAYMCPVLLQGLKQ